MAGKGGENTFLKKGSFLLPSDPTSFSKNFYMRFAPDCRKQSVQIAIKILVHRRFVPQLCTKTPDKQIQNVESTSFTRKKNTKLNVRTNSDLPIDKP